VQTYNSFNELAAANVTPVQSQMSVFNATDVTWSESGGGGDEDDWGDLKTWSAHKGNVLIGQIVQLPALTSLPFRAITEKGKKKSFASLTQAKEWLAKS